MILGLVGRKSAGKDTAFARLQIIGPEYGFAHVYRYSFADKLKQSAAALFDVPVETWDEAKNNPYARVRLTATGPGDAPTILLSELSVREFLQRYGTESHREIFGGNFWVDQIDIDDMPDELNVVTDVRFPEEAERIFTLGGFLVYINCAPDAYLPDEHASETSLRPKDCEFSIENFERNDNFFALDNNLRSLLDVLQPDEPA